MLDDFCYWVSGIFEDDPIPYEIKFIYFALHKQNNHTYISLGGTEQPLKRICNFEYYPLEAQYFNIQKYNKNFDLFCLRKLIEKSLKNNVINQYFNKKTLFFGIFFEKNVFFIEN